MTVTVNGVTSNTLTTLPDLVTVTGTEKDIILGSVSGTAALNTLNTGDLITGNGLTKLRVVYDGTAADPIMQMSGVKVLDIFGTGGGTGVIAGTNIEGLNVVKLSGSDGDDMEVNDVAAVGSYLGRVSDMAEQALKLNGTLDGVALDMNLTNDDDAADGKGAIGKITAANDIILNLVAGDTGTITYANNVVANGADAVVGDLVVGDIRINLAAGDADADGYGEVNVSNEASVNAGAGSATVGDLTIGDVNIKVGAGHDAYGQLSIDLTANGGTTGDATVGDLTIGDISLDLGTDATYFTISVDYSAIAFGDAKVGNLTIGDVSVRSQGDVDYAMYSFYFMSASATGAGGDATVGDFTIGQMDYQIGLSNSEGTITLYHTAQAKYGNATVGDMIIGGINIVAQDYTNSTYPSLDIGITSTAEAAWHATATAGNAIVGDMLIGDITITGGQEFSLSSFDIQHKAQAEGTAGTAQVGDTIIGDITLGAGRNGLLDWTMSVTASATAQAGVYGLTQIGKVVLGNIDMSLGFDATGAMLNTVNAEHGRLHSFTVGDVSIEVGDSVTMTVSHNIYGASIGKVQAGDVVINSGYNASMDYELYASATGTQAGYGNIRKYSIGDTIVSVDDSGGFSDLSFYAYAQHNIGSVEIGDIIMDATGDGTVYWSGTFSAENKIGSATIGNVSLMAEDTGVAYVDLDLSGDDGLAVKNGVTIGDVTLRGKGDSSASAFFYLSSTDGNVGDITLGDVSMKVTDDASANFALSVTGDNKAGQKVGDITVGDIDMIARAAGTLSMAATIKATDWDVVGNINIGDVRMIASNGGDAAANDEVEMDLYITLQADGSGDINIGDVLIRNIESSIDLTQWQAHIFDFDISATDGNHDVNIGNIKVVGGFTNSTGTRLDNFNDMQALFDIVTTGKITLGNVDYSKYEFDATIGTTAWDWHGMTNIKAAQGDTEIYDSEEQNIITLYGGEDTIYFATNQTADENDEALIDTIIGFEHNKDVIDLDNAMGSDFERAGSFADYASFLASAHQEMADGGVDLYTGVVGGDTFAAIDSNDDKVLDWTLKIAGVTNITYDDFDF